MRDETLLTTLVDTAAPRGDSRDAILFPRKFAVRRRGSWSVPMDVSWFFETSSVPAFHTGSNGVQQMP